jgi:NYN domain-containing protein
MDRCAVFVDAGYLLAEGGWLCHRTKRRADLACDHTALTDALSRLAREHSELPMLRLYWYDAAPSGIATPEYLRLAVIPNVKVRLGRLVEHRQKGVDSLIVRDLITLAAERAVVTAYLVGGDEDIREGVAAAQALGVRVVLLGIGGLQANQALSLVGEADERIVLDRGFWARFLRATAAGAPPVAQAAGSARSPGQARRWPARSGSGWPGNGQPGRRPHSSKRWPRATRASPPRSTAG